MNLTAGVVVICLTLIVFMLTAAAHLQKSIAVEVRLDNDLTRTCFGGYSGPTVEIDARDSILVDDLAVEGLMKLRGALNQLHKWTNTSHRRLLQRFTLTCGRGERSSPAETLPPRARTVRDNKQTASMKSCCPSGKEFGVVEIFGNPRFPHSSIRASVSA